MVVARPKTGDFSPPQSQTQKPQRKPNPQSSTPLNLHRRTKAAVGTPTPRIVPAQVSPPNVTAPVGVRHNVAVEVIRPRQKTSATFTAVIINHLVVFF